VRDEGDDTMRVTITIDEEKVFQAERRPADEGDVVTTSGQLSGEAKPMSAGGPPVWLLREIGGGAAEADPAQTPMEPMDAGPAPAATGNGRASMQAYFGR
jgi:hypothetical protein